MPYKRPESVLVVVYTRAGEVLLMRRRAPADFWQSVTGSLKAGESPVAAARRELAEETGLMAEPQPTGTVNRYAILPEWRYRYAPGVTENTEHVFAMPVPERFPVALSAHEHSECRWVSKADALALATSHTNREAIRDLVPDRATG